MSFTLIVGVLVGLGGGIGYLKAKSTPSLVAGLSFGLLFGYASHLINSGNPNGFKLGLVLSIALLGVMGKRFAASGKFMPAGLMSIVAAISTVYHLYTLI